ncbi:MAG: tRNA pseudouridine synthase A [Chlamydiae bacterium]|nr:tRNA pseudouridine synthase A [Chlamydiota bacterium]
MKQNIKCLLAYSGARYHGWQKTRMGPSIEEELQKSLVQILQHPIKLQAASRTDRGVHAEGQVVNFFTGKKDLCLKKIHYSLNQLLPNDLSILNIEEVEETFHPTLHAKGKEYHYKVCNAPYQLPFHREFSWHYSYPLQLDLMDKGAKLLVGKQDFSAFTTVRYADAVRTVLDVKISSDEGSLLIRVRGENFLYKMVRNIVGTLLHIGAGKIPLEELPLILSSKKRALAGVTAPAHGLCLKEVFY